MCGADITCATDIRFHGGKVFVSAMDEGSLVSADNGGHWRQLWPRKWSDQLSGHNWRLGITGQPGAERIIATASPWNAAHANRVILSDDGGKTFQGITPISTSPATARSTAQAGTCGAAPTTAEPGNNSPPGTATR